MKTFNLNNYAALSKRIVPGLLIVLIVGALGFVFWAEDAYQPNAVALQALQSDSVVKVTQYSGFITFQPVSQHTSIGFIFYPGGRVDYRAYAPVLHEIAAQGYFVAVVHVKLNLAFFDVNAADKVISQFPEIEKWAMGGHSLGGVAAALYTNTHHRTKSARLRFGLPTLPMTISRIRISLCFHYMDQTMVWRQMPRSKRQKL